MRYEDYQVEVVTGVAFAVVWLGVLVLGFQSLLLDLALGGIGGWTLYRAFGGIVYGRARHAWQKAAETLDLEFHEPRLGDVPESSTRSDGVAYFLMFLANSRRDFELRGTVAGEAIEAVCEPSGLGRATVLRVDFSDKIPDWLEVRKGTTVPAADDWMRAKDIPVGDPTFDETFLVHGPDADPIREFLDTRPITDVLVGLGEGFDTVEIIEGELRVVRPSVSEDTEALVADIERVAEHAGHLRDRLGESEIVADFHGEEDDETEEASEQPARESSAAGAP